MSFFGTSLLRGFKRFMSTGPGPASEPSVNKFEESILGHPFRVFLITAKYLAFTHLFMEYGFTVSASHGPSMLPTFEVLGEWVLVSRWHRFGRGVSVGDLIAYNIPINNDVGVKRVLGLPGDYVLVNSPETGSDVMIQVPRGHCWIVGDNLPASRDSRFFGAVPLALVRGKILARIRPYTEFSWIVNPLQRPDRD